MKKLIASGLLVLAAFPAMAADVKIQIDAYKLKNQKEAVKQERRLSFDNQPYNTAIVDVWPTLMFRNWQSSHSLIGSFEDLNSSSVADVSRFFKTYYAPDNAALVIVGDIQTAG